MATNLPIHEVSSAVLEKLKELLEETGMDLNGLFELLIDLFHRFYKTCICDIRKTSHVVKEHCYAIAERGLSENAPSNNGRLTGPAQATGKGGNSEEQDNDLPDLISGQQMTATDLGTARYNNIIMTLDNTICIASKGGSQTKSGGVDRIDRTKIIGKTANVKASATDVPVNAYKTEASRKTSVFIEHRKSKKTSEICTNINKCVSKEDNSRSNTPAKSAGKPSKKCSVNRQHPYTAPHQFMKSEPRDGHDEPTIEQYLSDGEVDVLAEEGEIPSVTEVQNAPIAESSNDLLARRSSRKAKSPKRKVLEVTSKSDVSSEDNAEKEMVDFTQSPDTPKRRRKSKPQKLVRQDSTDDNSVSYHEKYVATPGTHGRNLQGVYYATDGAQRKSKTNAKTEIGKMVGAILSAKAEDAQCCFESDNENSGFWSASSDIVMDDGAEVNTPGNSGFEHTDDLDIDVPKATWSLLDYFTTPPERRRGRPKGSRNRSKGKSYQKLGQEPIKGGAGRPKGRKNQDTRPFSCPQCQTSFVRQSHLRRHLEKMHAVKTAITCQGCARKQRSELTLMYHVAFGCKRLTYSEQCGDCELKFQNKDELLKHKCSTDPAKKCSCPTCEYKCSSVWGLEQHIKTHTGEKSFKCSLCSFATAWKKNLKDHMIKHTGLKPFVCELCDFATSDPHNLRSHRLTHSSVKAFLCDVCGKKFKAKSMLKIHMVTHSNERPYKCHLCTYATKYKSCLRSHVSWHSVSKKYGCENCTKTFRSKIRLVAHLKRMHHSNNKKYSCQRCGYAATSSQSLNSHMRKHSKKTRKVTKLTSKQKHKTGENSLKQVVLPKDTVLKQGKEDSSYSLEVSPHALFPNTCSMASTSLELFHTDIKPLDVMANITSQDIHDFRNIHQDDMFSHFSVTPGDVLAILPCVNSNPPTIHTTTYQPEMAPSGDSTRPPQYEELLYNSNASQADTVSAMINLVRELKPQ